MSSCWIFGEKISRKHGFLEDFCVYRFAFFYSTPSCQFLLTFEARKFSFWVEFCSMPESNFGLPLLSFGCSLLNHSRFCYMLLALHKRMVSEIVKKLIIFASFGPSTSKIMFCFVFLTLQFKKTCNLTLIFTFFRHFPFWCVKCCFFWNYIITMSCRTEQTCFGLKLTSLL